MRRGARPAHHQAHDRHLGETRRGSSRRAAGSTRAALVSLLLTPLLTGCMAGTTPGTPDPDTWRYKARLAVGDVSSEVATAKLVLQQEQRHTQLGPYERVVLTYSDEAASQAASGISSLQPPSSEEQRAPRVTDALERAAGLVTDARVAVTSGNIKDYPGLVKDLAAAEKQLGRVFHDLHAPAGAE